MVNKLFFILKIKLLTIILKQNTIKRLQQNFECSPGLSFLIPDLIK